MQKLFWGLVALLFGGLIFWFSYVSVQPRAIPKIKLSAFESPLVAANSVGLRLQEELRTASIWLWGLDPNDSFQRDVLFQFLQTPSGNYPAFDEVWLDSELGFDLPNVTRKINFKAQAQELVEEIAQKKGRLLIVTVTPYAASFLEPGPAWLLGQKKGIAFYSILMSDFPRRREDEEKVTFPCVLPHADRTGIGDLGCQIQQRSRLLYRKKLTTGDRVGFMDQVSGRDFVFAFAIEPSH